MDAIDLCNATALAGRMGIERVSAVRLAESGKLGSVFRVDGRPYVSREVVDQVSGWSEPPKVRALVVRVKPAVPEPFVPEFRPYMGWHADLEPSDRKKGVAGFWQVADPDAWHGDLLIATISGVVVEVGRITDHDLHAGGLVYFNLTDLPPVEEKTFLESRYGTVRGGNILRLEGPSN
jgi:hypothetical protein